MCLFHVIGAVFPEIVCMSISNLVSLSISEYTKKDMASSDFPQKKLSDAAAQETGGPFVFVVLSPPA